MVTSGHGQDFLRSSPLWELPERIAALPAGVRELAERLLAVDRMQGRTVPPQAMTEWIIQHFGGVVQVQEQTILRVTNLITLDTACFNPLRAHRPQERGGTDEGDPDVLLEHMIAAQAGPSDPFRDPWNGTTADCFGRIVGNYCLSASNVAKYDGWHGLVIFHEFHPLRFTRPQLLDYFDVALRWLLEAHRHDPQACYPLITWNCLWKSGASLTHGHLQMILSRGMASGKIEQLRRAVVAYRQTFGSNFFADLCQLHGALGLGFGPGHDPLTTTARPCGYVSLTPVKDREVVLLGEEGGEQPLLPHRLIPLWELTYETLRNLIDQQRVRSFNLVVVLSPLAPTPESWEDLPVHVRIVDRGDPTTRLVNVGAMELFANSVITVDPFLVASMLRSSAP